MLQRGIQLGNYVVEHMLGEGAMATVYEARHAVLGTVHALKVLKADVRELPAVRARFIAEGRIAARLNHPKIVRVTDTVSTAEAAALVMELVPGPSLDRYLSTRAVPLSGPEVRRLFLEILDAIRYAHDRGIIHRDVKPANVLLLGAEPDQGIKVTDFGIAKVASEVAGNLLRAGTTSSGGRLGTLQYMSPEQLRNPGLVTIRSDIFSLGATLYEMASGRPPFEGESDFEVMQRIVGGRWDRNVVSDPVLAGAIARALEMDPERRFANCEEFAAALQPLLGSPFVKVIVPPVAEVVAPARGVPGWEEFAAGLPSQMADAAHEIRSFLEALFGGAERVEDVIWALVDPRVAWLPTRQIFCIFVPGEQKRLNTVVFKTSFDRLELHLPALSREGTKVILLITDAPELARGVRRRIFQYRRDWNAFVLPLYVGEVRRAAAEGWTSKLLLERLRDLHAAPDPFTTSSPATDSTSFYGMRGVLNEVIASLERPGAVISLHGLPGAGKSSLVNMAEFAGDDEFVRIRCSSLGDRTVDALVREVSDELGARLAGVVAAGGASPAPIVGESIRKTLFQVVPLRAATDPGQRAVLVLEDADWLVELTTPTGVPTPETEKARQFWATIAEWARMRSLRVIITSVRGFVLHQRVLAGWENPLASHVTMIQVPSLDRAHTEQFVGDRALSVGVTFSDGAVDEIHRLSAGHVDVIRRLCSRIMRRKNVPDHPFGGIEIKGQDVAEAAADLVAMGATFHASIQGWLSPCERRVLREVATRRPRSVHLLKRALAAVHPGEEVAAALERLRGMGFVERRDRKECVHCPLLDQWIPKHMDSRDDPAPVDSRRLSYVTAGLATTALLFVGYASVWIDGQAVSDKADWLGCTYTVLHSRASAPEESISLFLQAECSPGVAPVAVTLRQEPGTAALMTNDQAFEVRDAMSCGSPPGCRPQRYQVRPLVSDSDVFAFSLAPEGGKILRFAIRKDKLATTKRAFAQIVKFAGAVPALLGVFLAFYRELFNALRRLAIAVGLLRRRPNESAES